MLLCLYQRLPKRGSTIAHLWWASWRFRIRPDNARLNCVPGRVTDENGKHYHSGSFGAPVWWSSDAPDGELVYMANVIIDECTPRVATPIE